MNKENTEALTAANIVSNTVQKLLQDGNMELAHRATVVYNSILLTIILTELVPGAKEHLDLLGIVPEFAGDGSRIQ